MKKWNCSVTSILMFALLFLMMPQKSATAQKLISETLQSKTLVEEDDGFKWYRYVYEYQVKFGGNKINLTRESAYNTNGRVLIDGSLNIDWIKEECQRKSMKKKYKQYPSEIKKEYSLILEYVPSYGLFVAKRGINDREVLGTFSKEGMCFTYLGGLGDNGILWSGEPAGSYLKGGEKWLWGKAKYGGHGVVKEGKVVVPMQYDRIKVENGLYFGEGCANSNDVYTSDGVRIGTVGYDYWTEKYVSYEFFDGPNGEKWLKYCNSGYYSDNKHKGFYYCLESGKKIDYGSNDVPEYHIEGRYLMLGNDLYKGDGERITNNEYTNVEKHLSSNNTSDFFLVSKGIDRKGVIKVEGNSYKEVIACEYGKISCLNADDGGDLFLISRPYNGDIDKDGVIKVEGNRSKEVLSFNYSYFGSYEAIGRYIFLKRLDEYYTVVVDNHGNTIVPLSKNYYLLSFYEEKNVFEGYKRIGNTHYVVTLDLNGKELSSREFKNTNQQAKQEPKSQPQPKKEETKPTPTPTPTPTPDPPRPPQPFQVWQACFMCGGSGQCRYCYGYGWAANGKDACGICHGTGKCSQCAGHGGQNVIEYR